MGQERSRKRPQTQFQNLRLADTRKKDRPETDSAVSTDSIQEVKRSGRRRTPLSIQSNPPRNPRPEQQQHEADSLHQAVRVDSPSLPSPSTHLYSSSSTASLSSTSSSFLLHPSSSPITTMPPFPPPPPRPARPRPHYPPFRERKLRYPQQQQSPQLQAPWRVWESLAVNISNLPKEADTFTLWQSFNKEGSVFSIDIFDDYHGNKSSRGKVRFKPPPQRDFWRNGTYAIRLSDGSTSIIQINLDANRPESHISSPIRPDVSYPPEVELPILSLDIGVMVNETTLLPMRTIVAGTDERFSLVLDLKRRAMLVYFQLPIVIPQNKPTSTSDVYQQYRLKVPFVQLTRVFQTHDMESRRTSHLTVLSSPPLYHRRVRDIANTFIDESSWRDSDTWFRQTYIVRNPLELSRLPVSLRKSKSVIDIGRWNAFKITYPEDANKNEKLTLLCNILNDYNIAIENTDRFNQWDDSKEMTPPIWKWIDLSDSQPSKKLSSSLEDLIDQSYIHLPFSVRYQLEVCLSNGYLSEFTMTREFAVKLSVLGEEEARRLLEHVVTKREVYHDPMEIFDLKFIKGVTRSKIPAYCCYMRSARVTPSTIYYNTPSVEISNRIVRHFIEYADRFLRVRFTDEKLLGRINSTTDNTMDEVFTRIKRALANGIVIGDRRYEFLAFGNSQFREHGAYFFAPLPNLTAANIRAWMGHFNEIRNVAKHAARLGQCFSTTRAISGCRVNIHIIDDVDHNGYTFSDGVGRISKFLAQMAMSELKIKTPTGDPPSAFQFRLGGCKGMLTVYPQTQPQVVEIRKSQFKFSAKHNGLEIIRWSQFSIATLNRQLIIVLSTLGIPDRIFHEKLQTMLQSLNESLESDPRAIYWLKKYMDPNQMTLVLSQMVLDGFRRSKEPFLTSVLALWRAWHLKYLKEKAKIIIDKGANLLGCMDETSTLKGQFDKTPGKDATRETRLEALPEIFVQISRPETGEKYEVIEGICILARNPSLHPGDIRVVRAVNVPQLSHLQDVVVLPQTGDRDIASMCSGGDLDGDDYLVIWDQDLMPEDWFRAPMTYTSSKARDLDHDVTVDEITSFFVTYMKNDCLPKIAHAHIAWADLLENGVNEEKCIRLAQLHSDAVDYNKTGIPAIMTRNLQPRMWPHFMEKRHKPKERIYRSGKILGQLYDVVERIDFAPNLEMSFDQRILDCCLEVSDDIMQFARDLKNEYDATMYRIMAQHEIKTEFEVWSTFVLSHANMSKDYKFHEELGDISSSLREGFRKECYNKVGGRNFEQLAPLALAMYRVTHEEMTAALKKYREENPMDEKFFHKPTPKVDQLPLISFPWILHHILGKIALRHYEEPELEASNVENLGQSSETANVDQKDASTINSNPADSSLIHQMRDLTQSGYEDHFGLFMGDEETRSSPQLTVDFADNVARTRHESTESLDQLLDFGLSEQTDMRSSSRMSFSSVPIEGGVNLLELGNVALNDRQCEEEEGCIELVDEGDLEPTALDTLNGLLAS